MNTAVLNKETLVPISQVGAIVSAVLLCTFWVQGTIASSKAASDAQSQAMQKEFAEFKESVRTRDQALDGRLKRLEERLSNEWSSKEMEIWILRLQLANPGLKIPEIGERKMPSSTAPANP